jgi:hypothetical protein
MCINKHDSGVEDGNNRVAVLKRRVRLALPLLLQGKVWRSISFLGRTFRVLFKLADAIAMVSDPSQSCTTVTHS